MIFRLPDKPLDVFSYPYKALFFMPWAVDDTRAHNYKLAFVIVNLYPVQCQSVTASPHVSGGFCFTCSKMYVLHAKSDLIFNN